MTTLRQRYMQKASKSPRMMDQIARNNGFPNHNTFDTMMKLAVRVKDGHKITDKDIERVTKIYQQAGVPVYESTVTHIASMVNDLPTPDQRLDLLIDKVVRGSRETARALVEDQRIQDAANTINKEKPKYGEVQMPEGSQKKLSEHGKNSQHLTQSVRDAFEKHGYTDPEEDFYSKTSASRRGTIERLKLANQADYAQAEALRLEGKGQSVNYAAMAFDKHYAEALEKEEDEAQSISHVVEAYSTNEVADVPANEVEDRNG